KKIESLLLTVPLVIGFVCEVVGGPRERVDRIEMFSQSCRNQNGADRKVLVVRSGKARTIRICALESPRLSRYLRSADSLRKPRGLVTSSRAHLLSDFKR